MKKYIDVSAPVKTRSGEDYREAKTDAYGRLVLLDGNAKRQDQIAREDEIVMEPVPIGRLFNMALDMQDEKITAEERRKRFTLSCKIEAAMQEGEPLETEPEDRKRIEQAAENVKHHFFLGRIFEAVDGAWEKPKVRVKAANGNGKEAEAPLE